MTDLSSFAPTAICHIIQGEHLGPVHCVDDGETLFATRGPISRIPLQTILSFAPYRSSSEALRQNVIRPRVVQDGRNPSFLAWIEQQWSSKLKHHLQFRAIVHARSCPFLSLLSTVFDNAATGESLRYSTHELELGASWPAVD